MRNILKFHNIFSYSYDCLQAAMKQKKLSSIPGTIFSFYSCRKMKEKYTKKNLRKVKNFSCWYVTQNAMFDLLLHCCSSAFRRTYLTSRCCHVSQTFSVESSNIIPKRQDANSKRFQGITRNSIPGKELNIQMGTQFSNSGEYTLFAIELS